MTLLSSQIFKKHLNMQMSELMMSSPQNFPFILYREMTKLSYFSYKIVRLALIPLWIDACRIMLIPICIDMRDIHKFRQNINFSKFLCTKYMASSEAMTLSTHSFAYSYWCFQTNFVKICETSMCHNFLIFQPIFIKFSLFWLKMFTFFLKLS